MKYLSMISISFIILILSIGSQLSAVSLWNEAHPKHLFTDRVARNVGDLLTILVVETSEATRDSTTEIEKETSLVGSITSFLFPLASSKALTHNGSLPSWKWDNNFEFEGGGKMENKENFSAKITVRIIDVLPNGNMIFEGTKSIEYINEKLKIVINGIVSPINIDANNTVRSEFVSDFRIRYAGKGPVAQAQREGLLVQAWDFINFL